MEDTKPNRRHVQIFPDGWQQDAERVKAFTGNTPDELGHKLLRLLSDKNYDTVAGLNLVFLGASKDVRNEAGATALDLARERNDTALRAALVAKDMSDVRRLISQEAEGPKARRAPTTLS